ncbi:MAG: DUF7477 domain-containing protein, partial [Methylococcales bacterium]
MTDVEFLEPLKQYEYTNPGSGNSFAANDRFFMFSSGEKPSLHNEQQSALPEPDDAGNPIDFAGNIVEQDTRQSLLLETDQHTLYLGKTFPDPGIQSAWSSNQQISLVANGPSEWIVVLSQDFCVDQRWFMDNAFPANDVSRAWNEGYELTSICHQEGEWLAVLSKTGKQT